MPKMALKTMDSLVYLINTDFQLWCKNHLAYFRHSKDTYPDHDLVHYQRRTR